MMKRGDGDDRARRARVARLELAAAWVACVACSTFDGLSLARKEASSECKHATVQSMSMNPTTAAGENEFTVAVHRMGYAPDGGLQSVGFDLDDKCTGQGEGSGCRQPRWAPKQTDNPGGRDNSVLKMFFPDAGAALREGKQATEAINHGLITTIFRVRHYNGLSIDGSVEVEVIGATRSPSLAAQEPNDAGWDGKDVWKPIVDWTLPAPPGDGGVRWIGKYKSSRAYVNDHVLVAHLESAYAATNFHFSDLWIQARIVDGMRWGGRWALRGGTYNGRVRIDDLLANTEFTPDPETGLPYTCTDSPSYLQTKKNTCRAADVSFSGDSKDECDAASWAWAFDADPAELGDEVDQTRAADFHICPPETQPAKDRCATLDGDAQ